MDHERFDRLARRFSNGARGSRRSAVAALLGAAVLPAWVDDARGKGRKRRKSGVGAEAVDRCFPGTNCAPGRGKNASRCDFSFSTTFRGKDVRGANLSKSNFVGADLRGADLRGANLGGACLISADLSGATLGGSVNLGGAVLCNTKMPDGAFNNDGCEGATPCCHLRVHDCPNTQVGCLTKSAQGVCLDNLGLFPAVGTCWNRDTWRCCPCDHPEYDYWQGQCEETFGQACAPNGCVAEDAASVWECYNLCRD